MKAIDVRELYVNISKIDIQSEKIVKVKFHKKIKIQKVIWHKVILLKEGWSFSDSNICNPNLKC